jgi:UDP-N-acetylglucosamine 4-epimerase
MENFIKNSSFLITGGAGFIGSNLVDYLIQNEAKKVRVLDNLSTGYIKNIENHLNLPNFEFIEGDIRNLEDCQKACEGIDYVSHQAALGSVPRSINDPITTNEVNIAGFLNMLVAARDNGIKRMVYAASSSTYGDSKSLPKVEDVIGKPLSPYAVTKYVNELYADVFARLYHLDIIGLRYFNVFGPKQNPHGAYAAVIPLFINAILSNTSPTINGDGLQTRDFTYIDNALQANMKAFFTNDSNASNQVYNVAVGDRTFLKDVWETLCLISQKNIKANYGPSRLGDIKDSLADISKAQKLLNYQPKVKIKEGLEKTFEWFKTQKTE